MDSFEADITRYLEKAQGRFRDACANVAREVHNKIIDRTPVDTGRARGSWNMKVGEGPDTSALADGSGVSAAEAGALARSTQRTLMGYRDPLKQTIWVSNDVSYIEGLEHGSSKQAPLGMMALTLAEVSTLGVKGGGEEG